MTGPLEDPDPIMPGVSPNTSARCPLPACGEPLHITWTLGRPVFLDDTAGLLSNPSNAYTSHWTIDCEGGHTILTPPDTAEDTYTFGACRCEPTDPDDGTDCGHGDMPRLRTLLVGFGPALAAAAGLLEELRATLPTGHAERPGLVRAIEVLRHP